MTSHAREVAVVGAGAVGLLQALCLLDEGLMPTVFEKRRAPRLGSRSIGVHPPALELLDRLRLTERVMERAVRVRRGLAFGDRDPLGVLSFAGLAAPHDYVATIAQEHTESVLREALEARAPAALVTGTDALRITADGLFVEVLLRDACGRDRTMRFAAVIAADGAHGPTRHRLGIGRRGATYDGAYAMVDAPDATRLGSDAALFLTSAGLVESFPLAGRRRRWVVRRDQDAVRAGPPSRDEMVETIERRTRHRLDPSELTEPSPFRAEHQLAERLAYGPIALAGDAAHVVSPIGGQGMNLGWIGASSIARTLATELRAGRDPSRALLRDADQRRRQARAARRRAELNMWLGRPTREPRAREALVRTLLRSPAAALMARVFTMRGLALGV